LTDKGFSLIIGQKIKSAVNCCGFAVDNSKTVGLIRRKDNKEEPDL